MPRRGPRGATAVSSSSGRWSRESRMMRKYHVRFGGGPTEKESQDHLAGGLPNYLGDAQNPYTLFDLTAGRSQTFPQEFLVGFGGFVHADAYDGYNAVHHNRRHLGCWMHARRYFTEAEPSDPRAVEAL